jgi:septal ring factor EnvC (AmiA/AmiB activator)
VEPSDHQQVSSSLFTLHYCTATAIPDATTALSASPLTCCHPSRQDAGPHVRKAIFQVRKAIFQVRKAIIQVRKEIFQVRKAIFQVRKAIFQVRKAIFQVRKSV